MDKYERRLLDALVEDAKRQNAYSGANRGVIVWMLDHLSDPASDVSSVHRNIRDGADQIEAQGNAELAKALRWFTDNADAPKAAAPRFSITVTGPEKPRSKADFDGMRNEIDRLRAGLVELSAVNAAQGILIQAITSVVLESSADPGGWVSDQYRAAETIKTEDGSGSTIRTYLQNFLKRVGDAYR